MSPGKVKNSQCAPHAGPHRAEVALIGLGGWTWASQDGGELAKVSSAPQSYGINS